MNKKLLVSILAVLVCCQSIVVEAGWISRTWRTVSSANKVITSAVAIGCFAVIAYVTYKRSQSVQRTPLIEAICNKNILEVRRLIADGADINEADSEGKTPLMHAVTHYTRPIFAMIINKGPDFTVKDQQGKNCLVHAIEKNLNDISIISLLRNAQMKHNSGLNQADNEGKTPIMYAAASNKGPLISILGEQQHSLDAQDLLGKTALHYAIENDANETIDYLLGYPSVDISKADQQGKTPLMKAIIYNNPTLEAVLLDFQEPNTIQVKDEEGNSALYYAIQMQRTDLVKKLLHKYPAPANINLDREINRAAELGGEIPGILTDYRLRSGDFYS
jgi:ankyrin repeat protein